MAPLFGGRIRRAMRRDAGMVSTTGSLVAKGLALDIVSVISLTSASLVVGVVASSPRPSGAAGRVRQEAR